MENAIIKCFQDEGPQTSLEAIVKFLQHKNKHREYQYIIKDKINNKVTKLIPKIYRPLHFSQES